MSDIEFDPLDQRRHPRVAISKSLRARAANYEGAGSLIDISAGGAAVDLADDVDFDPSDDIEVELNIEDITPVSGRIARSFEEGFAVTFDLDQEEEDLLLAEVMQIHNDMQPDDD